MGVWGSCPSVGNIIGAYAVSHVLYYGYQVTIHPNLMYSSCQCIILCVESLRLYFSILVCFPGDFKCYFCSRNCDSL